MVKELAQKKNTSFDHQRDYKMDFFCIEEINSFMESKKNYFTTMRARSFKVDGV